MKFVQSHRRQESVTDGSISTMYERDSFFRRPNRGHKIHAITCDARHHMIHTCRYSRIPSVSLHAQPDTNCVCMSLQPFAVCQSRHDRSQRLQSIHSDLLRRYVLLERLRIDAAELACISVCGESVVRSRGIVSATTAIRSTEGVCLIKELLTSLESTALRTHCLHFSRGQPTLVRPSSVK
jgi:hypothetical protein